MKRIIKMMTLIIPFLIVLSLISIVLPVVHATGENDISNIKLSLVNQYPDPAIAGSIVELRVGVQNLGLKAADNVVVKATPEYPFVTISSPIQDIGTVQSTNSDNSNMQIVKFKFKINKDVSAGTYSIKFEEYNANTPTIVSKFNLNISVKTKDSVEISSINKAVLTPGKEENITFVINNVGASTLSNLRFSWDNSNEVILPIGSDNSKYIKFLEPGQKTDLNFNVIASPNAPADLYQLNLKLTYEDSISGNSNEINTVAGIYIGGKTNFDVIYSDKTASQMSFTISNTGVNNANSVTVFIPKQEGVKISGTNSQIIGNLNKGDYTTVSFPLTLQRINNLKVEISYTDTMGQRMIIAKSIPMDSLYTNLTAFGTENSKFKTGGRNGGPLGSLRSGLSGVVTMGKYALYIILIVVVVLVGLKYYRKHKKKAKN